MFTDHQDKSKIPEFTIKLNEILSSTSQTDHVFIVGDLKIINLLDPTEIENDFINNCHSNSLIPLINKPIRNTNNNGSILDHIWSNQRYDAFNGIFLLDITDHYPTTYSLCIAIVVLSRKKKYHLQDFASRGSLTLL